MTERPPWWKAFLPKWKSGGSKDAGSSNTLGPDFNPFAPASTTTGDQSKASNNNSSLLSNDTYDDSHIEYFNENTCRRNMKVSRSGRFKEKRKVRSSLPIQEKEKGNVASGQEDLR